MVANKAYELRERLLEEYADIAILALRCEAGLFLTTDEYYRAKESFMDALRGITRI